MIDNEKTLTDNQTCPAVGYQSAAREFLKLQVSQKKNNKISSKEGSTGG